MQAAGGAAAATAMMTTLATLTSTYGIEAGLVALAFAIAAAAMVTLAWALVR